MTTGGQFRSAPEIHAMVDEFIEDRRGELITLCADLVSARSENPPGRTVEAAAVVQAYLGTYGVASETLAHVEEKPNVVAMTGDRNGGRHLGFNGHLDTISPGNENEWSVPIYELSERDGRLFGLGIGNMKAGLAALTMAYAFLATHRELWRGQLSYSAVADETVFGGDGAGWLLSKRPDLVGDALICGEGPGAMQLAVAEKGLLWVEIEATAPSGQGMLSQRGGSAIARLAGAVTQLDGMNDEHAAPPTDLSSVAASAGDHGLRLSVNTGTVHGGTFVSQSAARAVAEIDFRIPPGLTIDDIDRRLNEVCRSVPDLAHRHVKGWNPNWTNPQEDIVRTVEEAAALIRGATPEQVVRLPASDASRWRAKGVPAICYGPQPLLASGVDDFVNTQDVIDCAKVYTLSALTYLA